MNRPTLIAIVGATASGKSDLALRLAQEFNTSIISADSRQLYKETTIGTAKPTAEELQLIPHYFIDHVSIETDYNAGTFEREVLTKLDQLFKDNPVIIMAGGSGLYIQALLEGFDELPQVDPAIREELNRQWEQDRRILYKELQEADPDYYKKVDLRNPQRVVRALEIIRATGQPFSTYHNKQKRERPFNVIKIGLDWDREVLYERINQRVDQMMAAGLLEEARNLHPKRGLNALETVGYTELFDHLEGKYDLDEAIRLIKRNTRRYAKRQMTWFRRDVDINWYKPRDFDSILTYIRSELSR